MTTIGYFTIWARPHTDSELFRREPCHYKFGIKTLSIDIKTKRHFGSQQVFYIVNQGGCESHHYIYKRR